MSTFKNKNSLRTIEAQIVQKLKHNEARPKFTGSYKKNACIENVECFQMHSVDQSKMHKYSCSVSWHP